MMMMTTTTKLRHVHMTRHADCGAVALRFDTALSVKEKATLVAQLNFTSIVEEVTSDKEVLIVELTYIGEAPRLSSFLKRRGFTVHVPLKELANS